MSTTDVPAGDLLIRGAYLLDLSPGADAGTTAQSADVRVSGGVITEIGPDLPVADSEVVEADGMLLTPGLVDTHLHMWQTPLRGMTHALWSREYFHTVHPMSQYYSADDMYWAAYAGGLELLSHGTTRVFDYCHSVNSPEHADASIAGLRDAGVRATFGFALFEREVSTYRDRAHRLEDMARLKEMTDALPLVDLALGIDHDFDQVAVDRARELGVQISVHGNPVGLAQAFADAHALGPDVLWTHGNYSSDAELHAMAESGTQLALTPEIEMGMGKPTQIFDRAIAAGITITLGVDVVSYACPSMLQQMHLAYNLQRLLDGERERTKGHIPPHRDASTPRASAADVARWATIHGNHAMDLGAPGHGIEVGARADLVLLRTEPWGLSIGHPAGHLVQQASSRDVHTVIVDGHVRVREGRLTGDHDLERISGRLREIRGRLLEARDLARTTSA